MHMQCPRSRINRPRYLQRDQSPLVKLVLQAFQMSVPSCMQRSLLPIMRRQLVLRTMAAAALSSPEHKVRALCRTHDRHACVCLLCMHPPLHGKAAYGAMQQTCSEA
jgi:hypothetical protein